MPTLGDVRQARKYVYKQLSPWQTRLLRLNRPGPVGTEQISLLTVDFTDMEGVGISGTSQVVQYTAVSHVWSHKYRVTIFIDGGKLVVPADVASILGNMIPSSGSAYVW